MTREARHLAYLSLGPREGVGGREARHLAYLSLPAPVVVVRGDDATDHDMHKRTS